MAESVDALVSNTSGATRAGSTPALGTSQRKCAASQHTFFLCFRKFSPSVATFHRCGHLRSNLGTDSRKLPIQLDAVA